MKLEGVDQFAAGLGKAAKSLDKFSKGANKAGKDITGFGVRLMGGALMLLLGVVLIYWLL